MSSQIKSTSNGEENVDEIFTEWLDDFPINRDERLNNLGLLLRRQLMGRIFFMKEIYEKIIPVHGSIMEFGVRWGQNLALFSTFRGMLEPYNYNRKIIGFDTFQGFPATSKEDGEASVIKKGNYDVTNEYEKKLNDLLEAHQELSPISHIKKFELIKGDVTETLDDYLERHPETIISLAYFDFDLYLPTKYALERVISRMPKGGVIAFDELNYDKFPGETLALLEVMGIQNLSLRRVPYSSLTSYAVIE